MTTFILNGILKSSGTYSTSWTTGSNGVKIGRFYAADDEKYFHGYMDEIAIYNGAAKYKPVVTGLGTSTITPSYLSDPTGNHFTPTALAITDQMLDTPENNFCTLNSEGTLTSTAMTYTEGNLKVTFASSAHYVVNGTMGFSTGKWYWEAEYIDSGTTSGMIGIRGNSANDDTAIHDDTGDHFMWSPADDSGNGRLFRANPDVNGYGTFTNGDIVGVAVDMDSTPSRLAFYVNGVFANDQTDLTNSTFVDSGMPSASLLLGIALSSKNF